MGPADQCFSAMHTAVPRHGDGTVVREVREAEAGGGRNASYEAQTAPHAALRSTVTLQPRRPMHVTLRLCCEHAVT